MFASKKIGKIRKGNNKLQEKGKKVNEWVLYLREC